jgi:hypothetical protein
MLVVDESLLLQLFVFGHLFLLLLKISDVEVKISRNGRFSEASSLPIN